MSHIEHTGIEREIVARFDAIEFLLRNLYRTSIYAVAAEVKADPVEGALLIQSRVAHDLKQKSRTLPEGMDRPQMARTMELINRQMELIVHEIEQSAPRG